MIEIILILSALAIFLILCFVPFNYILASNNSDYIDRRVLNLLSSISLILLLNICGFKLSTIINIFYIILLITLTLKIYEIFKNDLNIFNKNTLNLLLIIFICFIVSLYIGYNSTLTWEAQTIWIEKTIPLIFDKGIVSIKDSPSPELPFLFPVIWSFFWKLINMQYEYLGRIFIVFIYLLSLNFFAELLKLDFKKKIIFFLLLFLISFKIQGFQGDLEVLLFSLVLLGIRYYYLIVQDKNFSLINFLNFILILNLLLWTSNEGMFYSFFILFFLLISKNISKYSKIKFFLSLIFLLIFKVFVFTYYDLGLNLHSDDYALANFGKNFSILNLLLITKYLFFNLLRTEILLVALIFMFIELILFNKVNRYNIYVCIINIVFIYSFFLFNAETLEGMLKQKMMPLLYMSSSFFVLSIINNLNLIFKGQKK